MIMGSWVGGALNSLGQTINVIHLPTCDDKKIGHFFCELAASLRLPCEDTSSCWLIVLMLVTVLLLIPFGIIYVSYIIIVFTVLHINSPKKGNKLLATCSSHLIVLSLFFGPVIFTCMTPGSHTGIISTRLYQFF